MENKKDGEGLRVPETTIIRKTVSTKGQFPDFSPEWKRIKQINEQGKAVSDKV